MKKILLAFSLAAVALVSSFTASAQTKLIIVHNCPDPAAANVDVWVRVPSFSVNQAAIVNFPFRNYFVYNVPSLIPAGTPVSVDVKAPNSTAGDPAIYTKDFPTGIPAGDFIVEAVGLVNAGLKNVNTNDTFQLAVYPATVAAAAGKAQVALYHGVPDAGAVTAHTFVTTIQSAKKDSIATGIGFASSSSYLEIPAASKRLHLFAGTTPVLQANADVFKTFGGNGLHIFASGFADTALTNGGKSLGLFYLTTTALTAPSTLAGSPLVEIPREKVAGALHLYHNSPDTLTGGIDLLVNGDGVFLNNSPGGAVQFRKGFGSAGFIQDFDYNIEIVDDNTTTPLVAKTLRLNTDIVVAYFAGVGSGYAANPDGVSTAFSVFEDTTTALTAPAGKVYLNVFHGAPDAPAIDVYAFNPVNAKIINNLKYGEFQKANGGNVIDPLRYVVDVRAAGNTNSVKSYIADLSAQAGKTLEVFASGFLNPAANKGGAPFALFAGIFGSPSPSIIALTDTVLANSINDPGIADMNMRLFPNPATTSIQMVFDAENAKDVAIEIVNINGQVVKAVSEINGSNGKQFAEADIRDLNSGFYVVRVRSANKVSNYKFNIVR